MYTAGRQYSSLFALKAHISAAFNMAVQEDAVLKNPCKIKLDFIPDNRESRIALTRKQQADLLEFTYNHTYYRRYYDMLILLFDCGFRIGEFIGLTISDIDFDQRKISINHQLIDKKNGELAIETVKTKTGVRYIPMTNRVYESLQNVINKRKCEGEEFEVDGYSGFLFLSRNGKPYKRDNFANRLEYLVDNYRNETGNEFPKLTPHICRHTFCSNLINAGVDAKTVQYLMGHSSISVTLNVYAHTEYDNAAEAMKHYENSFMSDTD